MNFMSNSNQFQVQNQGQIAQAQSNKNEYRRVTQPYKRKSDSDVEAISDDKKKVEQILGKARPKYIVDIVSKGDELTEEDLSIIEEVQQHFEEEQSQELEEGSIDNFVCSLTKCYIPGCEVHTLLPNCIHYGNISGLGYGGLEDMSQRMKKGYECFKRNPTCSYIEVYEKHICIIGKNGISTVINE